MTGYNRRPSIAAQDSVSPPIAESAIVPGPASPAEVAIELADVTFGYDPGRHVLDGISMTIPRGKVVAIMGGSGCGKTTLLTLIGGLRAVQTGKLVVPVALADAEIEPAAG